jgi:uncharacterized protein YoxC
MYEGREPHDFEDILKETELDSAKMVLRLTSELREKELELASTRSRSFEEVQRNNKAKEAEFEALMRAQEERIARREQDLARSLVEKESALWQKYQAMLDDAVARQRSEFETERELLKADIEKKEAELAAQKKHLRLEMEALFKKWEAEREADFKTERETFIEELKLGRETAKKEALERARQMEELWRQKLSQQEADFHSREDMAAEEIRSQMRRERVEELKALNDRLNAEFSAREQELYAHYAAWLEENRKLIEDKYARRLEAAAAENKERVSRLEDALAKARADLETREKSWEEKYAELKKFFVGKEAALETAGRELQAGRLAGERELSERHEQLERELREEGERRRDALLKKEKNLEQQYANNLAELAAETERRMRTLETREAGLARDREESARMRAQIGELLAQKQRELEQTFEERSSLLKQSLEESYKIKELSLSKKYEEIERQYTVLTAQKDAALTKADSLLAETARLKEAILSRDSEAREVIEGERARMEADLRRAGQALQDKADKLKEDYLRREEAVRADYAQRLQAESSRLGAQLRIKEEALEKERASLGDRAAEMEARFLESLKEREAEVSENFRRHIETLRNQAETARRAWDEEKTAIVSQAASQAEKAREEEAAAAARRVEELKLFYEAREKELKAAAAADAAAAERVLAETFAVREQDLLGRVKALEESLARAAGETSGAATETSALKDELKLLGTRLEESERDRQKLMQENLTKARDLRQTLEKEFLDKLKEIEQNYLGQLTDFAKRSDEARRADQDEYFRKLQYVKDDFNGRLAAQAKEVEAAYLERERSMAAALDSAYKLKEKSLEARQAQLENNYQAVLSEKASRINNDRELAESVGRLKEELEHKNLQLKETIASYNTRLEELEDKLRAEHEARKKDLEDTHRMRTSQVEAERAKLKGLLEQEQRLVTDLQKREAALQEGYAAREAELARRFKEARERLEKDYQDKLKEQGGAK